MLKIRFLVKIIENLTQTTWFFLDYLRIRRWKEFGIELAPDNHVPRRILSSFPHRNRFPSGAPPFDHGSAHRLLLCAAPSAAARSAKALKRRTEICPSAWELHRVGGHSSGHCYPLLGSSAGAEEQSGRRSRQKSGHGDGRGTLKQWYEEEGDKSLCTLRISIIIRVPNTSILCTRDYLDHNL